MAKQDAFDAFTAIKTEKRPVETCRREAARLRGLAVASTTPKMRQHLEDRAQKHDRLAGDLISVSEEGGAVVPGQPGGSET
jgi:hypothetical protein